MKGADGFVQGYQPQAAVDRRWVDRRQLVTQAANDKGQLQPMVAAIEQQCGQRPQAILADSGYCSEENLKYWSRPSNPNERSKLIGTDRQAHGEVGRRASGATAKGATRWIG